MGELAIFGEKFGLRVDAVMGGELQGYWDAVSVFCT
jgi:hypothetical protein